MTWLQHALADDDALASGIPARPWEPFAREAEELLARSAGTPIRRTRSWANLNAQFVVFEGGGRAWILKALLFKPAASMDDEFESLEQLREGAQGDRYTVPTPIHLWRGAGAYLATFEAGRRLSDVILAGIPDEALHGATRAGEALAGLHRTWAIGRREIAIDRRGFLAHRSWQRHAPRRGDPFAAAAIERCAAVPFPLVRAHLDYDPVNLLLDGERLVILDPPTARVIEVAHWDLAVFTTGLRRSYWRRLAGLGQEDPAIGDRLVDRFLGAYRAAAGLAWRPEDQLMLHLCELARLVQLRRWWSGPARDRQRVRWLARRFIGRMRVRQAIEGRLLALRQALMAGEAAA